MYKRVHYNSKRSSKLSEFRLYIAIAKYASKQTRSRCLLLIVYDALGCSSLCRSLLALLPISQTTLHIEPHFALTYYIHHTILTTQIFTTLYTQEFAVLSSANQSSISICGNSARSIIPGGKNKKNTVL